MYYQNEFYTYEFLGNESSNDVTSDRCQADIADLALPKVTQKLLFLSTDF